MVKDNQITLDHLRPTHVQPTDTNDLMRQPPFGYTDEDLKTILSPSALFGENGRLDGIDTPLPACPNRNFCSIISSRPSRRSQPGD